MIRMHDTTTGESRIVGLASECRDEIEIEAFEEAVETGEVITMGITIAEPIRIFSANETGHLRAMESAY
jgi:hypothetical protein